MLSYLKYYSLIFRFFVAWQSHATKSGSLQNAENILICYQRKTIMRSPTIFLLMNICNGKNSKKKSMSMLMN